MNIKSKRWQFKSRFQSKGAWNFKEHIRKHIEKLF